MAERKRTILPEAALSSAEAAGLGATLVAKTRAATSLALGSFGLVALFAFAQATRKGLFAADYIALFFLSLLSMAAVYLYAYTALVFAAGLPRWRGFALTTAGVIIPFAVSYYLVGYRGFWHLLKLRDGFSWWALGTGVVFLLLGFFILHQLRRLWEVRQAVDAAQLASRASGAAQP